MGSKAIATQWVAYVVKVLRAFFHINDTDEAKVVGAKISKTLLHRVVYSVTDYWLMIASGAFIIIMDREFGYGPLGLFLLMWAFDIVVASAFVSIWQRTGRDITLGESYRRAADIVYADSRVAGYLAFLGVMIKAAFWDGPEHVVIFFRKEIGSELRMFGVLLVLTAVQAAIWTPIYVLGFDSMLKLYHHIVSVLF